MVLVFGCRGLFNFLDRVRARYDVAGSAGYDNKLCEVFLLLPAAPAGAQVNKARGFARYIGCSRKSLGGRVSGRENVTLFRDSEGYMGG